MAAAKVHRRVDDRGPAGRGRCTGHRRRELLAVRPFVGRDRLADLVVSVRRGRRRWPEVDRQGEDPSGEGGVGVAEHREVHVVELHLLDDATAFGTFDGRQAPPSYRRGAFAKPRHHRPGIENLGHPARLPEAVIPPPWRVE